MEWYKYLGLEKNSLWCQDPAGWQHEVVKGAECALMDTSVSPLLCITALLFATVYLSGPNQTARFVIYTKYTGWLNRTLFPEM